MVEKQIKHDVPGTWPRHDDDTDFGVLSKDMKKVMKLIPKINEFKFG